MPDAFGPAEQPAEVKLAVRAWNIMRGLNWQALPIVCEMLGVEDVESLILQLCAIRDQEKG